MHRPWQEATVQARVNRNMSDEIEPEEIFFNILGDDSADSTWEERQLHGHPRENLEKQSDLLMASKQYGLNMLLEYSNETVLMTQDREKPIHFPNLMVKT